MATATGNGVQLTPEQIAAVAYQAGFRGDALVTMVAIALAESGGVTGAHNPNGEDSRGLWQINVNPSVRANTWGDLYDPLINARAAWDVSGQGKNFNPWTTYSGATAAGRASSHTSHMAVASAAAAKVGGDSDRALANRSTALDTVSSGASSTRSGVPTVPVTTGVSGTTRSGNVTPNGDGTVTVTTAASPTETRPDITADSTAEEVEEYIRTYYPNVAPFLGDPAIKMLLYAAAINDWDDRKLSAAIDQTTYWKTHSPESRAFDELLGRDPKAAEGLINRAKGVISDVFQRNGMPLDDKQIGELAKQAIRSGAISLQGDVRYPDKLNDMVAFGLNADGSSLPEGGDTTANSQMLGAIAKQYLVPIDQQTLDSWAVKILQGTATQESFTSYIRNLAKGQWTNDADLVVAIDAGTTVAEFFAPHRSLIAQTLELAPDQVDFNDPRWRSVTQMWDAAMNGGKGGRRAMTLGEVEQFARDRPEYMNTRGAQQGKAEIATNLTRWLGRAA